MAVEQEEFVTNGFIKIERAFSRQWAEEARDIMWRDLDVTGMTVLHGRSRLSVYRGMDRNLLNALSIQRPCMKRLMHSWVKDGGCHAMDSALSLYVFQVTPIRVIRAGMPSFQGADGSWRTNVNSKGRALLMLFLFSDIGINDAPTRILTGSHLDVPQILDPFGEEGLDFITLSRKFPKTTLDRPVTLATGEEGRFI